MRRIYPFLYLVLLALAACGGKTKSTAIPTESVVDVSNSGEDDDTTVAPTCGNGILDDNEECDNGQENSDTTADTCRTTCRLPACGDAILDTDETCDDGNTWGGDGCNSHCVEETHTGETEPNNSRFSAQSISIQTPIVGSLFPDGDTDCYAVALPEGSWLGASLFLPNDECPEAMTLRFFGPTGDLLKTYFPNPESNCVDLRPETEGNEALQFLASGDYVICVEGFLQSVVPDYVIQVNSEGNSCTRDDFDPTLAEDLDGDSLPDVCDDDEDGDGALDTEDNCPRIPNSNTPLSFTAPTDGFIRNWLVAGPMTETTSETQCLPSIDNLGPAEDATLQPGPGDTTGEFVWDFHLGENSLINFLTHWMGGTPREAYAMAYVYSESSQNVQLTLGPDDGAKIWMNQTLVAEIEVCQGAAVDKYTYPVTLNSGWNSVLLKIRDGGGSWGFYCRFLDTAGEPLTNLTFGLDSTGNYTDNQSDWDSDGIGDLCDPTPFGEESSEED